MIEPLRLTVDLQCSAAHAFDVWTTRWSSWWPKGHSASGDPATVVTLEPRLGGRIYERTAEGVEIDWGEVTRWDPPRGLAYLWHIGRDRGAATDVEVTFADVGDGSSRVEIVQTGWDRLGEEGAAFRGANAHGWDALIPSFATAADGRPAGP